MARTLHLTSPEMAGEDVASIQRQLEALGYPPGRVDGVYGPATEAAVRAFQSALGLEVDGVVGPQTRKGIRAARAGSKTDGVTLGPTRTLASTSPGLQALGEALRHLGAKERPANSNRTEFGKWFGVDGCPWCAIFVSYCFANGAAYTICGSFKGAGVYAKGCTYVPTAEAWLRATGMWVGRTTPQPGDIAIYNWNGGVPDHIGIVEEALAGGSFHAIEGNTSYGNDSNGGEVMRRLRFVTQVDGFGRVTAPAM